MPGVCYGASTDGTVEPLAISVDVKALRAALDPVRKQNTVLSVTIVDEGKGSRELTALLKDYEIDPIRRDVIHVDLLAIDPDKPVVAEVSLEFIGKPKGAIEGGQIHIALREIELGPSPADLPDRHPPSTSRRSEIADVLHVSDLALPEPAWSA